MMPLRIIIGIVVCVAISAWAFYIDNMPGKSGNDKDDPDADSEE